MKMGHIRGAGKQGAGKYLIFVSKVTNRRASVNRNRYVHLRSLVMLGAFGRRRWRHFSLAPVFSGSIMAITAFAKTNYFNPFLLSGGKTA